MDVGQKNIACGLGYPDLILSMQGQLKIITPVVTVITIIRQYRVVKENAQPLKILVNAIQHNDVGRDNQKIAGKLRIRFIELVEIAQARARVMTLVLPLRWPS